MGKQKKREKALDLVLEIMIEDKAKEIGYTIIGEEFECVINYKSAQEAYMNNDIVKAIKLLKDAVDEWGEDTIRNYPRLCKEDNEVAVAVHEVIDKLPF